jgi:cytoskeleton protein RodZ
MGPSFEAYNFVAVRSGRENHLPSFGEKLKLEREKRAITLEQISLSTKIGMRMLQALEEEKFNQLPGGIFNKGFVRAYAKHVGLDEDQAVADYLEASGEGAAQADAEMEAEIAPPEPREPFPSRQFPWGLFAAVLLLVALALWFWSRRQHKNNTNEEHLTQSSAPAATQKPVSNSATGTTAGSPRTPVGDANSTPTSAPAKEEEEGPLTKPVPASEKNAVTTAAKIAPATPATGEFTVVILAREDSWISITADGKPIIEETLVAEDQRAVHAQKDVIIKVGNTGALDFVFNGKKLNSQGDYGEVKTLTFRSTGLQPPPRAAPVTQ